MELLRLAVLFSSMCCWPLVARAQPSQPQEALETLLTQVESGRVQSIELIYFPIQATSDHRMAPERLEKEYLYKIIIRELSLTFPGTALRTALNRTAVVSSSKFADVRWGLTFHLTDGSVRKVYLDGFGRLGQIDDSLASFRGRLYDWLRQLTAPLK